MSTPARMDVVVPVHGGWLHVERCLEALEKQTVNVNVVVVDDRSPDDTLERVRSRFGTFTIIENERNLGFSASCNAGIRASASEFVMLLNSDVVAEPDLAAQTIAAFERAGESAGSVAPILLSLDGTIDSFGITADVTGAGYVRFHGAPLSRAHAALPRVLGPYGAAAGYRRAALEDTGLLDENIFMYGEELELAFRLRAAAWEAYAAPFVAGTHVGGASAGLASTRQLYLSSFGRAYLLRVYGVLRGRYALRAIASEAIVVALWTLRRRDLTALRGRRAGWQAGRGVARRRIVSDAPENSIGFVLGMRMRREGFWATSSPARFEHP